MLALAGRPREQIVGRRCTDLMECACTSPEHCNLFSSGKDYSSVECAVRRPDGTRVPVLKNCRIVRDAAGAVRGAVESLTDISALRSSQARIEELERSVRLHEKFHGLVGRSAVMQSVYELVDLAAASEATVLVTGETGTGKELVARAIHERSSRAQGPIITVNCSALPENLLESELFGHVKGAFTGAIKDKLGRFEMADGGTLFLDEIGEISPLLQVKLLRFLQEREFERVGESTTRKSDVRIVAATNRDLRALVRHGEFRDDLYYRLKVFPIHLPRLRDRKEDIGPLVDHFIARFREQTGKQIGGLSHEAAVTLMDYCWPGNIRELENAIEHAFVTCREELIGMFDLPLEIRRVELRDGACAPGGIDLHLHQELSMPPRTPRRPSGQPPSREELRGVLESHGWNRNEAAKGLGVERTTLWRWMKRHGIAEQASGTV